MVAFARNLTGVKKFRPPNLETTRRKPASRADMKGKVEDRGARIPTREVKVLLGVLESFLGSPESQQLDAKALKDMSERRDFLRKQLASRDARDNAPLSAKDLKAKLTQAAPTAARNGMRVSLKSAPPSQPIDFNRGLML